MDLVQIRKLIIASIGQDNELYKQLVLKGGNALGLVHEIGTRTSVDVDFSISDDFTDLDDIKHRLFGVLRQNFDDAGFFVFDEKLTSQPERGSDDPRWGGYRVEFKIIEKEKFEALGGRLEDIRRQSFSVGDLKNRRSFRIEISKYEYVEGKLEIAVDDFFVYAYSPVMISVEKLRAICQQMDAYRFVKHPRARARDFYDIHAIVESRAVRLERHMELLRQMFAAKDVPLRFLERIEETRDFHSQDWPAVQATIDPTEPQDFDFYFEFVVRQVRKLEPLWEE